MKLGLGLKTQLITNTKMHHLVAVELNGLWQVFANGFNMEPQLNERFMIQDFAAVKNERGLFHDFVQL